jgi:CBS domain-containing protein
MNRELLYLAEGSRPELARRQMLRFGVTAVPVLDDAGRPVSMISLRDLVGDAPCTPTTPVFSVTSTTSIESAARALAETEFHHAVVVDATTGRAVGMVSSIDLLRALLDIPPRHPAAFPAFREGDRAKG